MTKNAEQVLVVRVSLLNRPDEAVGTASYHYTDATTLSNLAEIISDAAFRATKQAMDDLAEVLLYSAIDEIKNGESPS